MTTGAATLHSQFTAYARFGEGGIGAPTDGTKITLTNTDVWLKQARLLDDKIITHTDTGVCFSKMKTRTISYHHFVKFIDELATYKHMDAADIKTKLCECGIPGAEEPKKHEKKRF